MNNSLIPTYNLLLQKIRNKGITKITCNALFEQYGSMFNNNFETFRACLEYLEKQSNLHIVRADFEPDLILAVEIS